MRRVWMTVRRHALGGGLRRAALVVPGVAGLLTAVVMSATAATAPPPSILSANGVLSPNQYLQSADGHFRLIMRDTGALVETIAGGRTLCGRRSELESAMAGRHGPAEAAHLEQALVNALLHGANWKLTVAEQDRLRTGCLTDGCRKVARGEMSVGG